MRFKLFLGIFLIWFCMIGSSLGLAAADDNYFPLQPGNRWNYRVDVGGQVSEAEIRVAAKTSIDNLDTVQVDTSSGGVVRQKEFYAINSNGIFTVMRSGFRFDPLQYFLKYPVEVGDSWTQTGKLFDNNRRLTYTYSTWCKYDGLADIGVPAGSFNTLKLVLINEISDGSLSRTTRFLANGVGIVREITSVELKGKKITVTSQLTGYQLAR